MGGGHLSCLFEWAHRQVPISGSDQLEQGLQSMWCGVRQSFGQK